MLPYGRNLQHRILETVGEYEYPPEKIMSLSERLDRYERLVLICELQRGHKERKDLAKILGISLRTLFYKLEKHDLQHHSEERARQEYLHTTGANIHEHV